MYLEPRIWAHYKDVTSQRQADAKDGSEATVAGVSPCLNPNNHPRMSEKI